MAEIVEVFPRSLVALLDATRDLTRLLDGACGTSSISSCGGWVLAERWVDRVADAAEVGGLRRRRFDDRGVSGIATDQNLFALRQCDIEWCSIELLVQLVNCGSDDRRKT